MNILDFYVLSILIIYLAAFFIRNLKTYFSIKKSIRGRSLKLTLSLALSTIIYLLVIIQLVYPSFHIPLIEMAFLEMPALQYIGSILLLLALGIGLAALYEMRNSWRVGIKHDQKTDLVTSGVYSMSRNPYFLSYNILFFGLFLIFPFLILLMLIIAVAIIFHLMIKEEERYLENVQGNIYLAYKNNVARYLIFI